MGLCSALTCFSWVTAENRATFRGIKYMKLPEQVQRKGMMMIRGHLPCEDRLGDWRLFGLEKRRLQGHIQQPSGACKEPARRTGRDFSEGLELHHERGRAES